MLCPEFKVRKLVNVTTEMSAELVVASHASYLWFVLFYRKHINTILSAGMSGLLL